MANEPSRPWRSNPPTAQESHVAIDALIDPEGHLEAVIASTLRELSWRRFNENIVEMILMRGADRQIPPGYFYSYVERHRN